MVKAEQFGQYVTGVAEKFRRESLQAAMEDCRDVVVRGVLDSFARSVSPEGDSWPPRKNIGDGHPLLMDTHVLLNAATSSEVTPRGVKIGGRAKTVPYAATHQFGDPQRNIPQRKYLGASEETLAKCDDIIANAAMRWF